MTGPGGGRRGGVPGRAGPGAARADQHAHRQLAGGQVYLDARISDQLWAAIRQDAITAFAEKYPFTVTPAAPR